MSEATPVTPSDESERPPGHPLVVNDRGVILTGWLDRGSVYSCSGGPDQWVVPATSIVWVQAHVRPLSEIATISVQVQRMDHPIVLTYVADEDDWDSTAMVARVDADIDAISEALGIRVVET